MASMGVVEKPYPSCTSRVLVEYAWCTRGSGLGWEGHGYTENLTSSFPLDSAM